MTSRFSLTTGAVCAAFTLTATAHAQDATALKAFERIASACKTAFEAQQLEDVMFIPPTKKWAHRVFSRATVAYDVQRTNSLVSPYTAKIRIEQAFNSDRAEDEASARALTVVLDDTAVGGIDTIEFAFQDGQWKPVGGDTTSVSKGAPPTNFRRQPETLFKLNGPISACFGN